MKLLKSLLVAIFVIFGATSSWALTADLSMDYKLAGYKAKAFYDFTANSDGVLPTSGDLRFRDGYGLYNYGSGNRSGDAAIAVNEGDVIVCQFADTQGRSVTINTISGCTKSTTLNDGSHIFFTADSELSTLTFNVGRAGCVVSVLVMEVDASVAIADYTVNYVCDGNVVKTVSATGAVGGEVLTDASFFADDVKYIRKDGEPESFTIAAKGNTFTVNVRLAATYGYTLTDNFGTTIATGSGFEGEKATVGYPRYLLASGKFYEAGKTNNEYRKTITLDADNATATVEYAEKVGVNAVFYAEGENISGMTVSTNGNIPVRASNALAGVATEDVTITTLPAGKYIFHVGIFTSKSSYAGNTVNFGIGEETFAAAFTSVNLCEVASEEYTLTAETAIKFLNTSWGDAQFDYIWIEKTGVVTGTIAASGYSTLSSAYALDFASATGLTAAFVVSEITASAVILESVQQMPANSGVILKGTGGAAYEIPAVEAATFSGTNKLKAAVTATEVAADEAYILKDGLFHQVETASTVPAGKAYILAADVPSAARSLSFAFGDETTAIDGVENNVPARQADFFNIQGQRVDKPVKGLYIVNGKKVIVK